MSAREPQPTIPLIGTKSVTPPMTAGNSSDPSWVLSPATLTAAYSGNVSAAVRMGDLDSGTIFVSYTAGTNPTSFDFKLEYTGDDFQYSTPVNWFQETVDAVSNGTTTEYMQVRTFTNNSSLVAGTTYKFSLTLPITTAKGFRISAKETLSAGTAFGSVYIEAIPGQARS